MDVLTGQWPTEMGTLFLSLNMGLDSLVSENMYLLRVWVPQVYKHFFQEQRKHQARCLMPGAAKAVGRSRELNFFSLHLSLNRSLWWGACVTGNNTWGQGCMSGFSDWSGVGPSSVSKQLLPAVTQGLPWSPHLSEHPHKLTIWGLPWWFSGKESACQCRRRGFNPWSGRIPHTSEQVSPHTTTTEPVF